MKRHAIRAWPYDEPRRTSKIATFITLLALALMPSVAVLAYFIVQWIVEG